MNTIVRCFAVGTAVAALAGGVRAQNPPGQGAAPIEQRLAALESAVPIVVTLT